MLPVTKMAVFWVVAPCKHVDLAIVALKMEAASISTSKKLLPGYMAQQPRRRPFY
jgi:hypothetical protein